MAKQIAFEIIARDKASKTFAKIGGAAKLLGVVGLGAVVKNAVDVEAQFSKSMNVLKAATGAGTSDMAKMTAQAKKLGADTSFSANEAADAMLELGKAGFDTKQIMSAVPEVMNLAATEGMALADAAGAVTSALAQFGMGAEKSAIVVNALAGASLASKASVSGLSQSLSMVGSSAASIGLNVQDTAAALAALAQGGLEGSIAGTSLSAVFNRLVPTTAKASKTMRELDIDFTNADGSFKSITQIAGILQREFKGMDAESRNLRIGDIFGRDASTISAVNALISAGSKGLSKYRKETKDQTSASRMSEAAMKGTGGALEKMQGSLETASLAIGQMLAPAVVFLADKVGAAANKFVEFTPKIKAAGEFVKDNKGAFIALATAIGTVVAITKIHTAVMAVQNAGGLLKMIKATKLVTSATKAYAAVQWLLNAALTANPIGLVVVAIALLVGGLILLYKKSDTVRGILDKLWKNVLKPLGSFLKDALLAYVKLLAKGWLLMGEFGVKAFRLLLTAAFAAFNGILTAADKGLGWIPGLGDKIGKAREAFKNFSDKTVEKLKGVEEKLKAARDVVNDLGKDRHSTITVGVNYVTTGNTLAGVKNPTSLGHNANGTPYWRGGLSWVGERGPELVDLPRGSRVYDANKSRQMARGNAAPLSGPNAPRGGGSGGVTVIVNGFVGNESQLGREIEKVLSRHQRATGRPLFT